MKHNPLAGTKYDAPENVEKLRAIAEDERETMQSETEQVAKSFSFDDYVALGIQQDAYVKAAQELSKAEAQLLPGSLGAAHGTGEYAGEEMVLNYHRRQAGLPEIPITWGVDPGTYVPGRWSRGKPIAKPAVLRGVRGWILRRLIGNYYDNQHAELQEALQLNKTLLEQSKQQALHDPLTGLANRRLFSEELKAQLARTERNGESTSIVFLDLDHFKAVNDDFGHDVGDALIVTVANRLQASVRAGDVVARLGGDEFVLMLTGTDDPTRVILGIQDALAEPIEIKEHTLFATASIGASISPVNGTDPDTLLKEADDALYASKRAGRNTYRLAPIDERKQAHG